MSKYCEEMTGNAEFLQETSDSLEKIQEMSESVEKIQEISDSVEKIQEMSESVNNIFRIKEQQGLLLDQCFFCKKCLHSEKIKSYLSKTGKNYFCCNYCRLYCYGCDKMYLPCDSDVHEGHEFENNSSGESDGEGGINEN